MQEETLFKTVEEAICQGAIDEDMINLYISLRNPSEEEITELETLLSSCRCKAAKKTPECPEVEHEDKRDKQGFILNFDTVVHKCIGRKKKCADLVSHGAFDDLFERWHETVKENFGGWEDKDVFLEGEVYKHDHEADKYHLLLKKVTLRIGDETRDVPKIWVTVDSSEFLEAGKDHLSNGDLVTLVGRIEWDDHLHFFHLTDVTDLKVKR